MARYITLLLICLSSICLVEPLARFRSPPASDAALGHWITTDQPSEVVFVKTRLHVLGELDYASVTLSAGDEFSLWVNGKRASRASKPGRFIRARVDIGSLLKRGDNVIGIKSLSHSRKRSAMVDARITYRDDAGTHIRISDNSWLVASSPFYWTKEEDDYWSRDFDHIHPWRRAQVVFDVPNQHYLNVGLPHYVNPAYSSGRWFWPASITKKSVSLSKAIGFDIGTEFSMGAAVDGFYTIGINGVDVIAENGVERRVKVHDLTRYMEQGENLITLSVVSQALMPRLAVMAYLSIGDSVVDLSQPEQWSTNEAKVIFSSLAESTPKLTYASREASATDLALLFKRWLRDFLFIISITIAAVIFSTFILKRDLVSLITKLSIISVATMTAWLLMLLLLAFNWLTLTFLISYVLPVSALVLVATSLLHQKKHTC